MKNNKPIVCMCVFLFLVSGFAFAQEQSGEIIGTVVLASGEPIPGVVVQCTGPKLIGMRKTVTDENGKFRLMGLPGGVYEISFSLEGFKKTTRKGIKVEIGRVFKIDVPMETGTIEQEIVVTGEAPVIDVRKSASTVNITKEVFAKLPKGRNFTTIVTQMAGLNFEHEFQTAAEREEGNENYGAGLSFDGASSSENVFYVDGVDTTTLNTGTSGQNVNFDFIEEVQVKSSGYAAEYGGSMGGVINVITRSGGNEFHGSLMMYFDGSVLGYDRRPNLRVNPENDDLAEYVTYKEDSWTRLEPGLGIGGYIVKDRLWFFGSYLPKFRNTTRDAEFSTDPSANGEFKKEQTWQTGSFKLTAQIAENLRLSVGGTLDNYEYTGDLPALDGTGNPEKEYAIYGYNYPGFTLGGSLDYAFGNNLMFNATAGYWQADTQQKVGPTEPRYYHLRSSYGVPGMINPKPKYWYNYSYDDGYQTLKDLDNKLTATADLTFYANFGGEHVWKAGVQFVRIEKDIDDSYPYLYNRFYWGDDYEHPSQGTIPTTLGYVEVRYPFGVKANPHSNRWALYLQDAWTIGNKLTVNLGVRLEKEDIPSFSDLPEYDYPPIQFNFFDKIAPRIGFAYDVFGDSTLKIFGSFGLYYDVMKLAMAQGSYGGMKWESTYFDIVNPDWESFAQIDDPRAVDSYYGGQKFITRNWREPSFDSTQPDMKPYSKYELTLGVQKKLTEDISLSGRFLYNTIGWAIEDIGVVIEGSEHYFNGNPGSDWIQEKFDQGVAEGYVPEGIKATKAKRDYYSVQIALDKKFSHHWLGGISLTWSSLRGNFAGLASSDEHGRKSPGVERYFDAWFMTYNEKGEDYVGPLITDRPLQLKAYGSYSFDFGLTLGFNAYAMSGTPAQTEVYINGMQGWYPQGRNSLGRTPMLWQVDGYAEYNLQLSKKFTLQLSANVTNLTDNEIAQRIHGLYNQAVIYVPETYFRDGFDALNQVAAKGAQLDPRYKMERSYMSSLAARIGVKLLF